MAKLRVTARASKGKARPVKAAERKAPPSGGKKRGVVRSALAGKKKDARTARTLEAVAPLGPGSALLAHLRKEELQALQQALASKSVVLASSPRARDAAVFGAAAQLAKRPVLVASPRWGELFEQARALGGLEVLAISSAQPAPQRLAGYKRLLRGGSLLVVTDPGSLLDPALHRAVLQAPLSLVGVAGAHACSEHAHELSAAYIGLGEALRAFGSVALATCTRTSPSVVEQVAEAIGATKRGVVYGSDTGVIYSAQVVGAPERKAALLCAIQAYGAPGIVLTATPQEADAVYAELTTRGVPSVRAHAGMAADERRTALEAFSRAREPLVLVTQSPHANPSGLAGCPEASQELGSAPPRADLRFLIHYQAPLSMEQHFEDCAWLPSGGLSRTLADSSDAALVQAILAQQRIKPAAIEAMARVLTLAADGRACSSDTLALRASTSRRSAERVLFAFAERQLVVRDGAQVSRLATDDELASGARLLALRFAALPATDAARAEAVAAHVTSHHDEAPRVAASPRDSLGVKH
jgi:hypothetical protein